MRIRKQRPTWLAALAAGAVLAAPVASVAFGVPAAGRPAVPLTARLAGTAPVVPVAEVPARSATPGRAHHPGRHAGIRTVGIRSASRARTVTAQLTSARGVARHARANHERPAALPSAGFDGMLLAAAGTALTLAGWTLMVAGSRRIRRR